MGRKKKVTSVEETETASQAEADEMIESGEAEIPQDAIIEQPSESSSTESDYSKHPKFNKFNSKGKK